MKDFIDFFSGLSLCSLVCFKVLEFELLYEEARSARSGVSSSDLNPSEDAPSPVSGVSSVTCVRRR